MAEIFINYRREDDPSFAGRLFDRLKETFQADRVFMDVANVLPGHDFLQVIEGHVKECDVLLAIIGPRWLEASNEPGARRLDDPTDVVRFEIVAALAHKKRVIPVLVGDTPMPRLLDLPDPMRPLAALSASRLTHERFPAEVRDLVAAIKQALSDARGARKKAQIEEQRKRAETARAQLRHRLKRFLLIAAVPVISLGIVGIGINTLFQWAKQITKVEEKSRRADRTRTEETGRAEQVRADQARAEQAGDEQAKAEQAHRAEEAQARRTPAEQTTAEQAGQAAANRLEANDPALLVVPGSGKSFRDRLADGQRCPFCPEMVVAPAGTFTMGSPPSEPGRGEGEAQVSVMIARPFAVGKFAVTFDQWEACVADGGCDKEERKDEGRGGGNRPVINVLDRSQGFCRLAVPKDWKDLSSTVGGGARICNKGGHRDGILVGPFDHDEPSQL